MRAWLSPLLFIRPGSVCLYVPPSLLRPPLSVSLGCGVCADYGLDLDPSRPFDYMSALPGASVVISTGTFSKTIAPGLRLGWVFGHPDIVRLCASLSLFLSLSLSLSHNQPHTHMLCFCCFFFVF